jgi:hypothetical protein
MNSDKDNTSEIVSAILPLVRKLARIKKQAKALGLFTNDRELLECTGCDLAEDVTFDGHLMTYHRNNEDMDDCGLRFEELTEETFRCPVCGTELKTVIL